MTKQNNTFPTEGNVRAAENSLFLGVCKSAFWRYVAEGRIKKPLKLTPRVSVWDAKYIRRLAAEGLPEPGTEHPNTAKPIKAKKKAGEV